MSDSKLLSHVASRFREKFHYLCRSTKKIEKKFGNRFLMI